MADPDSIFYAYQKLIKLRHENEIVVNGDFKLVRKTGNAVLAYYRILNDEKWLVVTNLSGKEQKFDSVEKIKQVLITNYGKRSNLVQITLKPYEAFAVICK